LEPLTFLFQIHGKKAARATTPTSRGEKAETAEGERKKRKTQGQSLGHNEVSLWVMARSVSGSWRGQSLGHGEVGLWVMARSVSGSWRSQSLGHGEVSLWVMARSVSGSWGGQSLCSGDDLRVHVWIISALRIAKAKHGGRYCGKYPTKRVEVLLFLPCYRLCRPGRDASSLVPLRSRVSDRPTPHSLSRWLPLAGWRGQGMMASGPRPPPNEKRSYKVSV